MISEAYYRKIIHKFSDQEELNSNEPTILGSLARSSKSLLFAKAALGISIEDCEFDGLLERIYYRRDCTDFDINVLIRMLYRFGQSDVISHGMLEELKGVILDYDYWFHENNKRPGNQIIWTENHVLQYLTAEYLAGKLFPDEVFRMRTQKGRDISEDIRSKIIDYIVLKGKTGFCEWDSNVYADENLFALMNLYDFSGDGKIVNMSKDLLDIMFFQMAVGSYKGHYGCSHGRAYDRNVISSLNDNTGDVQKLAWDLGGDINTVGSVSGLAYASSDYTVPEVISTIALSDETIETRMQQSFDVEDGPSLGFGYEREEDLVYYWHNMAYSHRLVLENNIAMEKKYHLWLNEWTFYEYLHMKRCKSEGMEVPKCRCSNYMSRVNTITFKTSDYMLSCAQDFRKGEMGYQQHIWQATMDDQAIVFVNHPGVDRPGYWAGNTIMPKAVQHKNRVVAIYDINGDFKYKYTHAFFPVDAFDEVVEKDDWLFGKKGNGYVALFSQNSYRWSDVSGNEVICDEQRNIWLCQMGRTAEDGTFIDFINTVLENDISFGSMTVSWKLDNGDSLEVGYNQPLKINGIEASVSGYKRLDNRFAESDYMSGVYRINSGSKSIEIDFTKENKDG